MAHYHQSALNAYEEEREARIAMNKSRFKVRVCVETYSLVNQGRKCSMHSAIHQPSPLAHRSWASRIMQRYQRVQRRQPNQRAGQCALGSGAPESIHAYDVPKLCLQLSECCSSEDTRTWCVV